MSASAWTSTTVEWQEGSFPEEVGVLWHKTGKKLGSGFLDPVFGESSTWYFWDETWTDACGPFPTEHEARESCKGYAERL